MAQDTEVLEPPKSALGKRRHADWMIIALVSAVLGLVWALAIIYLAAERNSILERTRTELAATVSTLADLDEVARLAGPSSTIGAERRANAIWRALLEYPTASIWIETEGAITAGQRPAGDLSSYLTVEERRAGLAVRAAFPLKDVFSDWQRSAIWEGSILIAASIAFLVLAWTLSRSLRQRAKAESEAAAAEARITQLSRHRIELENTVAERTGELKNANQLLEKELAEHKMTEESLREHDGLLKAVAMSAAELLGSHSFDEAIPIVLASIGQILSVARVQISSVNPDREGHLRAALRHEWTSTGYQPALTNPTFQNIDLTQNLPRLLTPLLTRTAVSLFVNEITPPLHDLFESLSMRSFLAVPITPGGTMWGIINFIDAAPVRRKWSWAEIDTLETLAGLIGAALARARYIKELADANTIVQNSPTVLYRLRGEPSLPLIYISHNITKFGHEPKNLVGAPDWAARLIHPEDRNQVIEAITRVLQKDQEAAVIEFRLATGAGTYRWIENRYTAVRDAETRLVEVEGIMIDITERREAEEKIALLARTDSLTGLANRATFNEKLQQTFDATQRGAMPFSVLMLDIDHFKIVNDTQGHPAGDKLLQQVAERLRLACRVTDVVARLGGDEFAILQTQMNDPAAASQLAAKLQRAVCGSYRVGGVEFQITISIGIGAYLPGTPNPETIMAQADLALYRAKDEGRNRFRFHSKELDDEMHQRIAIGEDLRNAITRNEFFLQYQPQIELTTGKIVGMEALIRWKHPTRGILMPKDFLAIAEKTGVILALGRWVLDQAGRQMREWEDQGIAPPTMAVNVSLLELKSGAELLRAISDTIAKWHLEPKRFELDVTEAILAQITLSQNKVLDDLHNMGVGIAIDDFGTEYSSFSYLRDYRINHVKIDHAFVTGATTDRNRAAIIRAIIALTHEMGIDVIAEGVETRDQRNLLVKTGSAEAQGFYFSEPVDAENAAKLLAQKKIDRNGENTAPHGAMGPVA